MPTQDPNDFQGNQKSTSSKKIAPGDPMWTTGDDHNQQSFGWGYDYHDPVDLLKGDKKLGGYATGNSASNFGTVSFEGPILGTQHGNIVDLVINRTGGTSGDLDIVIKVDRLPPGFTSDPNTAILGNGRTRVVDGFDVCEVDIDVETPNLNDDNIYFDEVDQELHVKLRAGFKQTRIPMIIAYRTQINHLSPAEVVGTLTYRVDEYECVDMGTHGWPKMKFLSEHADCVPDGGDGELTTKTVNKTIKYSLLSVQVPLNFTTAAGPAGAPIEAYTTYLVNGFDKAPGGKDRGYTVGQTYTLESQSVIRSAPWADPTWTGGGCAGSINEVHQTSTYNVTGGFAIVTAPNGRSYNLTQTSTTGSLSASIIADPLNVKLSTPSGTLLNGTEPLSSTEVLLEWTGTYAGQNVTDLAVDNTDVNPDGIPAGGNNPTVTVVRDGVAGNLGSPLCMCLTALSAAAGLAQNYGASVIVNQTGQYKDYDKTTVDTSGNLVHSYITKTETLPANTTYSQWQSHKLQTIGDEPDITGGVPELAPGGLSDIYVNSLSSHIYGYADPTGSYGDTIDYLFDGPGLPSMSDPKHYTMLNTAPTDPTLHSFPAGIHTVPKWSNSKELSGAGYFWELGSQPTASKGISLVDDWVENSNDPSSTDVLYSLTALEINPDDYNLNKSRLKGYYMTCNYHRNCELYLKLEAKDDEPNFEIDMAGNRMKITVDKTPPYSGVKHAAYDPDQTDVSLIMHHLSGQGASYKDNDEIGEPTGDSLMTRLFADGTPGYQYAPIDPATGMATDFGVLSANDIMFLSLIEGYKASDARSRGSANPFKSPPVFHMPESRPIIRSIAGGGTRTFSATAMNTGEANLVLNYENSVEDVTVGETVSFSYDSGATTGERVGVSNQWILEPDEKVVSVYTVTPVMASGVLNFTHQIQADYIGFPPGVETEDIEFIVTVN